MQDSWLTIGMLVILALLIFFMFRNSRKRQRQAHELQEKVVPGVDVMTNFGLFGTIVSINLEENKVELEISPGTVITVHRQTVTRVIEPPEIAIDDSDDVSSSSDDSTPEYGERLDSSDPRKSEGPSEA